MDETLWSAMTELGNPYYWTYLSLAMLLGYLFVRLVLKKRDDRIKKFLSLYVPTMWIVFLVVIAIKTVFPVARPCIPCMPGMIDCNLYCLQDSSFPSGHTAILFAAFSSLFLAFRDKRTLALIVFPVLVAVSRVALGVHTVIDVVGGALIAASIAFLVYMAEKNSDWKLFVPVNTQKSSAKKHRNA